MHQSRHTSHANEGLRLHQSQLNTTIPLLDYEMCLLPFCHRMSSRRLMIAKRLVEPEVALAEAAPLGTETIGCGQHCVGSVRISACVTDNWCRRGSLTDTVLLLKAARATRESLRTAN